MKGLVVLITVMATASIAAAAPSAAAPIDLRAAVGTGVRVLEGYSGRPDECGVLESCQVRLPDYDQGVYYHSPWWPAGGNRGRAFPFGKLSDLRQPGAEFGPKQGVLRPAEGGFFLILRLTDGTFLAVLPLGGRTVYSWFDLDSAGAKLLLNTGHWGTAPLEREDVPLCAWARGRTPYEAAHGAWKAAAECTQLAGSFRLREAKAYPEPFEYLGWCSWEFYRHSPERADYGSLSAKSVVAIIRDYVKLGKPVRWMLVDNGHFNGGTDFSPKSKHWPQGYKPLADARTEDGVRWVGIWYGFMGGGKHPYKGISSLPETVQAHMLTAGGAGLPRPTPDSCRAFYDHLYSFAKRDGLDFVKIDFSTRPICHYAGRKEVGIFRGRIERESADVVANPYRAHVEMFRALEASSDSLFNGIMHCNWHSAPNLFNLKHGVVGRSSEDYKPGNEKRGRSHQFHSFAAMPWLGQVAWGDQDMFHSSDPKYGRLMAASKAVSGGPIYVSDGPKECSLEAILPLCDRNGRLLRPLAPGAPVYDDVFYAPGTGRALRVVAPLRNRIAVFAAYNLEDGEQTVTAAFSPGMYSQAPAMIQPATDEWQLPPDGLVYYDVHTGTGGRFDRELKIPLKGFSDCLIQVSPIRNGWAVIGRTDKYLCGAAVEVLGATEEALSLRLEEAGPLAIYSNRGTPQIEGTAFTPAGGGIYKANLPIKDGSHDIRITRPTIGSKG